MEQFELNGRTIYRMGDKHYTRCEYCHKMVCINKRLFGALHICVPEEEREQIDKVCGGWGEKYEETGAVEIKEDGTVIQIPLEE